MDHREWNFDTGLTARPDGNFGTNDLPLGDDEYEELLAELSAALSRAFAQVTCQGRFSRLHLLCSMSSRRDRGRYHRAARGDEVEAWIRRRRDEFSEVLPTSPRWMALDDLLDDYRLHADTGTPLSGDIQSG